MKIPPHRDLGLAVEDVYHGVEWRRVLAQPLAGVEGEKRDAADLLFNQGFADDGRILVIDLIGQIASEDRFGGMMVNGTGGQPDTHLGATLCPTGRAVIVLRSTAFDGAVSKIVAKHETGTLVTIPRYLADTVITEFGIARLLDKNHRQRAEELATTLRLREQQENAAESQSADEIVFMKEEMRQLLSARITAESELAKWKEKTEQLLQLNDSLQEQLTQAQVELQEAQAPGPATPPILHRQIMDSLGPQAIL